MYVVSCQESKLGRVNYAFLGVSASRYEATQAVGEYLVQEPADGRPYCDWADVVHARHHPVGLGEGCHDAQLLAVGYVSDFEAEVQDTEQQIPSLLGLVVYFCVVFAGLWFWRLVHPWVLAVLVFVSYCLRVSARLVGFHVVEKLRMYAVCVRVVVGSGRFFRPCGCGDYFKEARRHSIVSGRG